MQEEFDVRMAATEGRHIPQDYLRKPWAAKANPLSFLHDLLIDFYLMTTRCCPAFMYLWMGMLAADYSQNNKAREDPWFGFDLS